MHRPSLRKRRAKLSHEERRNVSADVDGAKMKRASRNSSASIRMGDHASPFLGHDSNR